MFRSYRIVLAAALMVLAAACSAGSDSPTEPSGPRQNSGYGVGSNDAPTDSTTTAPPEVTNTTGGETETLSTEESSGYGVGSN